MGKIGQAYDDFSRVELISNIKSVFSVKFQESGFSGVAKGVGNFELLLDFIPQDANIIVGEQIVTANLDRIFPKGLLVGEIVNIQKSDLASHQKATIKPGFELGQMESVFVIL